MRWSSIGGPDNAWTGEWFAFFNVEYFYYDYPLTQKGVFTGSPGHIKSTVSVSNHQLRHRREYIFLKIEKSGINNITDLNLTGLPKAPQPGGGALCKLISQVYTRYNNTWIHNLKRKCKWHTHKTTSIMWTQIFFVKTKARSPTVLLTVCCVLNYVAILTYLCHLPHSIHRGFLLASNVACTYLPSPIHIKPSLKQRKITKHIFHIQSIRS